MRQTLTRAVLGALILVGCSPAQMQQGPDEDQQSNSTPPPTSDLGAGSQEPSTVVPGSGEPTEAQIAGHAKFVVDNLARTLSSFDAAIGYEDCVYQGEDAQRFYNSLPGVGTNSPPEYGTVGNEAHREFLTAMQRSMGTMLDYCTALKTFGDSIDPDIALGDIALEMFEASRDIWFDFPALRDAPQVIVKEFCRAVGWSPTVQGPAYQSLLDNRERLIRRSLTRNADLARSARENNLETDEMARNFVNARHGTAAELASRYC